MYFQIEQDPKTISGYLVRLLNNDHRILLNSEPFSNKTDCLMCIRKAKQAAVDKDNFIVWDIEGYRFNLFYGTGLLVGAVKYKSAGERDAAVNLCRLAILEAEVVDKARELLQAA
ncbi:hypothetical protein ACFPMF_00160 [Larkinella bovis]|uniref:DUF4346 domain-containing protein n=1 Tax=Larkinella bovis TaxID=683041 RepID=A0ABW0I583_9BACT